VTIQNACDRLKHKYQFAPKHSVDAKGCGDLSAYWLGDRIAPAAVIETNGKSALFGPEILRTKVLGTGPCLSVIDPI